MKFFFTVSICWSEREGATFKMPEAHSDITSGDHLKSPLATLGPGMGLGTQSLLAVPARFERAYPVTDNCGLANRCITILPWHQVPVITRAGTG